MVQRSYTISKVIGGLFLLFVAICISLSLINQSLKKHARLVNKIDDPNAFINNWDIVLNELDLAGRRMYLYNVYNDTSALIKFDACKNDMQVAMDSLYKLADGNISRRKLVNQLESMANRRLELFVVRAYTVSEHNMSAFDKATEKIAKATSPKKVIKESSVVLVEDPTKVNKIKKAKTSFLKQFLAKKKGRIEDALAPSQADAKQDAIIKKKQDSLQLVSILGDLKEAEQLAKEENQKKVVKLIADEQTIDNQVYTLTREMEKAEIKATQDQVKAITLDLEDSAQDVMMGLTIGGFLFLLLFGYLIQRDITWSNKLQKQLDTARINAENLAKAREDFASNMSHEIRTPLNALVGFSEQLAKSPLNEEQQMMANALLRSSNHLLGVINPVLDYSKLISGKSELERATFKLQEVLLDVKLLYERQANEKGIKLLIDLPANLPDTLVSDVVKVRQVLYNLVSNAIKFTHKGHVKVLCTNAGEKDGVITLQFAISDTGIGITTDKVGTIFDEFTQADSSITRHYGGTGLGLTIAKRIVENMGGQITVTSQIGQGSTFNIFIPFIIAENKAEAIMHDISPQQSIVAGKTIIVCDDEEMNRLLLDHILTNLGAKVIEIPSAENIVNVVAANKPDLVLLDLHMPGISGYHALKAIRAQQDEELANVLVIAITGDILPDEKERCFAVGLNGFLLKPFLEDELMDTINAVFNPPTV